MPNAHPPRNYSPDPQLYELEAGTRLWRVHGREFDATSCNPEPSDVNFGGGRFDGTQLDPYPAYYAGLHAVTALAETLLRDIPYNDRAVRTIRRARVRGRRASVIETTSALTLVDLLTGPALAAVSQDFWLVQADPIEYHATRAWAGWIREQVPKAQGLIWPSKRAGLPALVLFRDRCPDGCLVADPDAGHDLDDLEGAAWINEHLAPYRARIARPRGAGGA